MQQTCPRRHDLAWWGANTTDERIELHRALLKLAAVEGEGPDEWSKRHGAALSCTYCGSLHPDEFMRRAEAGVELCPTDKGYKVYVGGSGRDKFYFPHLRAPQRLRFVELYDDRKLKIGYPGYFYTPPALYVPEEMREAS